MSLLSWARCEGRRTSRRDVLRGTAALAAGLAAPAVRAQAGPIRIIFPFVAGGSGDALCRLMADAMGKAIGETIIVESRPGAGGQVGVRAVIAAPPDGHNILITPIAPVAIHPLVFPQLPYDPFTELAPVTQLTTFDFALAIHPGTPAKTLPELIAWMKQDPKRATYGTPGAGTLPHFFGALLGEAIGVTMQHAAYRGSAMSLTDLAAGQVPMVMTTTSDLIQLARAGSVRVIAVSGKERSPFLPDVPTFEESGIRIVGGGWYGMYVRAGTPAALIGKYNAAAVAALKSPALRERIEALAMVPSGTSPEEFAAIQKADNAAWAPAVKASGFKPT